MIERETHTQKAAKVADRLVWENNSAQRIEWHNADVHFLVLFIVFGFSLEKCCYSVFNDMHANPSSEMMHISLQRPENWPVNQNAQI